MVEINKQTYFSNLNKKHLLLMLEGQHAMTQMVLTDSCFRMQKGLSLAFLMALLAV